MSLPLLPEREDLREVLLAPGFDVFDKTREAEVNIAHGVVVIGEIVQERDMILRRKVRQEVDRKALELLPENKDRVRRIGQPISLQGSLAVAPA